MFTDKSRVELLVDQIFFEEPTFSLNDYMTSAILDLRRAMARETQLVEDETLGRPPKLPDWLQTGITLPPWESEFLFTLFAEYPLSVVQGGSGCGKTSALIYAANYCAKLLSKLERDGKQLIINKLLFVVDLQDQDEALKTTFTDKPNQDQQTAQFLTSFCSTLDTELQTSVSDTLIGDLFDRTFLRPSRPVSFTTRVLDVRFNVGDYYKQHNPGQTADWKTALRALNSEAMPHGRVVARYLLLQELARQQHDSCSTRLVLVVDNIDPFPDYLQTALIRTFQAVTHGYRALGGAFTSPFSICLLARHSTATRRSGALDGVEAHRVAFRAADPADLIFFRLSAFLIAQDRLKTWEQLPAQDRDRLGNRLWLLWQRLTNPQDQFSRVFSGLAGTNARTGCKLARWWVLSPRMPVVKGNSPADSSSLTRAIGTALLLRVAHATARAIRGGGPCANESSILEDIPKRVFENLLGVLLGNRVVRMAEGTPSDEDVRTVFSAHALGAMKDLFNPQGHDRIKSAASSPVVEAAREVTRPVMSMAGHAKCMQVCRQLKQELEKMEESRRNKIAVLPPEDQDIARAVCLWLCEAVVGGVSGYTGDINSDESVAEAVLGTRPARDRTRPNRWESTSILVSPDSQHERTERSALNVFSADAIGISPAALHILCGLQEAKHGLDGIVIKERLSLWGFGDHEVRLALRAMVQVDRRLIYSKVKDFTDGTEDWFDAYHPVHISSAGSEYLKSVIPAPAYLQWALIEPSRLRTSLVGEQLQARLSSGLVRIATVLQGLRIVREDETQRLKAMGVHQPHDLRKSLGPVLWIFFASLPRFIIDLSGLRSLNRQEAHRIANEFIEFGNDQYAEFQDLFGMVPDEWGLQLGAATQDFRNRFGEWE